MLLKVGRKRPQIRVAQEFFTFFKFYKWYQIAQNIFCLERSKMKKLFSFLILRTDSPKTFWIQVMTNPYNSKRCDDDSFDEGELIPLKIVKKSFGDELKFHSNLSFDNSYVRHFPCFYKNVLLNWKQYLSTDPETISGILSQNLWFNKHMDNSIANPTKFSQNYISFIEQQVKEPCQWKRRQTWKDEYQLDNDNVFSLGSVDTRNTPEIEKQN